MLGPKKIKGDGVRKNRDKGNREMGRRPDGHGTITSSSLITLFDEHSVTLS
jgi:hypothetical protein